MLSIRRGPASHRRGPHAPQPDLFLDGLLAGPSAQRGAAPASRRHRQRADDGARPSRQGGQGPLRAAAQPHAEGAPRSTGRPTATRTGCSPPPAAITARPHDRRPPMERYSVQKAMRRVVRELGFRKAISIHTLTTQLRHPSARSRRQPPADPAVPRATARCRRR